MHGSHSKTADTQVVRVLNACKGNSAPSLTPLCLSVASLSLLLCVRRHCPCVPRNFDVQHHTMTPVPQLQSWITVENVLNPICCNKYPPISVGFL